MQLKETLTLSTRGNRLITEFLHVVKIIVDELAIIDHPVLDDDLTLYILNGFGPEYRNITAPIRTHDTSLSFEDLHDLLVGHEIYIHRMKTQFASPLIAITNYSH